MARLAEHHSGVSSDLVGESTEVITLDGAFAVSRAPEVEQRLAAAFSPDQADVVVDLRGVRSVDSAMLTLLVQSRTRAQQRGTRFSLIRPHRRVWRLFVLTGLGQNFTTYSSLQEALLEPES